jgi:hypothetical protein
MSLPSWVNSGQLPVGSINEEDYLLPAKGADLRLLIQE